MSEELQRIEKLEAQVKALDDACFSLARIVVKTMPFIPEKDQPDITEAINKMFAAFEVLTRMRK